MCFLKCISIGSVSSVISFDISEWLNFLWMMFDSICVSFLDVFSVMLLMKLLYMIMLMVFL